jgi:hypothetical protein
MSIIIKKNVIHVGWENSKLVMNFYDLFDKSKLEKSFKDFNPKNDAKIFITKGVNLPRVKLREYVKNKNIGLTTKLENADIVITSPSAILDTYTENKYFNFVNVEQIVQFKHLFFDPSFLDDYPYSFVSIHWHALQALNNLVDENIETKSKHIYNITDLDSLEEFKNKTLCYPDSLVSSVQEDGVIIDHDYYKQLDNMINSTDDDNLVLAMELMSNSYYDKSAAYLLILFYQYQRKFEYSSKKNHVNFKGLLDYFGMSTRSIHMPFNQIINELIAKKVLTKENMDIITELVIKPNSSTVIGNNYNNSLIRPSVLVMDDPDFVEAFGSTYTINL